jgi:hypothetical protein
MTGILLTDDTSMWFDQEKYSIVFEGLTVIFLLKKEYQDHPKRQKKMVLDYSTKTFYEEWTDGYNTIELFKGVI